MHGVISDHVAGDSAYRIASTFSAASVIVSVVVIEIT